MTVPTQPGKPQAGAEAQLHAQTLQRSSPVTGAGTAPRYAGAGL